MRLEVCAVAPENWDANVRLVGGTVYHSSIWEAYTRTVLPNVVPQFFSLWSSSGEILGVGLGFYEYSRNKLFKPFSRRLWFDAVPAVSGHDDRSLFEFLELIEREARGSGTVELLIDSYAYSGGGPELKKAGFEILPRLEFELQLEPSEDDLWKGLDYKRVKNIRKALRSSVTIHDLPPNEGLAALRRLQSESSQRIVARGGPNITQAQTNGEDPVAVLLNSGLGRIVGAQVDGVTVSAMLFTSFNGLVYAHLSGHSEQAFRTQAGTLLQWESIKQYRREGAKRFNMGGCKIDAMREGSPEHGVYAYKKAFGTTCLQCSGGQKTLRKATSAFVKKLRSIVGHEYQAAG